MVKERFTRKELVSKLHQKGYKCDKSRVSRDVKAGLYAPDADGKYNFTDVEELYASRKNHTTDTTPTTHPGLSKRITKAKTKIAEAEAEKKAIELETLKGTLVNKEKIDDDVLKFLGTIRERVILISSKVYSVLSSVEGITPKQQHQFNIIVENEVRRCLCDLSGAEYDEHKIVDHQLKEAIELAKIIHRLPRETGQMGIWVLHCEEMNVTGEIYPPFYDAYKQDPGSIEGKYFIAPWDSPPPMAKYPERWTPGVHTLKELTEEVVTVTKEETEKLVNKAINDGLRPDEEEKKEELN